MAGDNNNSGIDKTELVWPGKRKEVERVELPFQTIETINLPRGTRQDELFGDKTEGWKNRLIWGDNLLVMGSLLKEFAGKINLIYIDPPFATGDDFSFEVQIGDGIEITKEPSAMEVKAYRDTWGKGLQSYLQMMYDRLVLMKELLADDGSIYVHLDATVGHYVKTIMDEIFGKENFRRQIIWVMTGIAGYKGLVNNYVRGHDLILYYTKTSNHVFNKTYIPYSEKQLARFSGIDEKGRRYKPITKDRRLYLDEAKGIPITDVWSDIVGFHTIVNAPEDVKYPTQKPEKLLERIIKTSSNEDDLVADFFCGSGTTGVVAEKLGRRWIMSDLGRYAIHTTRKRLLDMGAKPFIVQNLGKYERHRWAKLNGKYKDYIKFILELYHAEPVDGFTHLHGKKDKSFVRVGSVDAPVTLSEIREALSECKENNIKKLDVLGWEWEMGLHDLVKEEAEKYGVKLATLQIPREVMELSVADAQKHDIQFYELAYLEVEVKVEGKHATITLKDFIIPNPELLPEEVKGKVKSWSDFIDYWAVDWMFNQHEEETEEDDTFHNMNQRYRTRKEPKLEVSMSYEYKNKGRYNILVKVIDIFGNDTTKLIEVKV
ncbi:MAG: site-specific DNA-methyltransferase [Patescibacteria group bacterium]|nr:MAG: site-specific DNA-methyltransferase [Patescibacteria group bacterium]